MDSSSSSQVRQYMTFSGEENPFVYFHWLNAGTVYIEHFAPRSIFSTSAQRYTDARGGCEEVVSYHLEIIALFTYLYWNVYECLNVPRPRAKKNKIQNKDNEQQQQEENRRKAAEDDDGPPSLEDEEKETTRLFFDTPHVDNRGEDSLFATMEVVPHYAAGVSRVAGLRLRIATNNAAVDFGPKLMHLFASNERRLIAEMNGKAPRSRLQTYQKITFERYCALVQMYTGRALSRRECNRAELVRMGSAIHPRQVFSIDNSCRLAKMAGAADPFFRFDRYVMNDGSCSFPEPARVYLLKHEYLKPDAFNTFMWPHVSRPREKDDQKLLFVRQFLRSIGEEKEGEGTVDEYDEDEGSQAARVLLENEIGEVYDQYHRCRVTETNAMDLESLKRRMKQRMENALHLADGDFEQLRMLRKMAQDEGLAEFQQIFHVDGDVPDSIKAIAKWIDEHLTRFRNFRLPFKKCSRNLSRFGDVFSSMAVQMECVFKVATLQAEVVNGFVKNFHVYTNKPFHTHTLFVGPPRVGKTFAFQVQQDCFIPGTWKEYAYQTTKSNIAPGKKLNHMIEFLEEAPPSMLGVVHQFGGKKQPTSGTDQEAMLKVKLTRGLQVAKVLTIDPVTNQRKTVEIEGLCNGCMNFACNENLSSFNPAMISRFHTKVFQYKDRPGSGGLLGKMQSDSSRSKQAMRGERIYRIRRNQALTAVVFYMIEGGILAPIDMTAANIVFSEVLKRARQNGLTGTDDVRNFERLCFAVEVLVVFDAVDAVYDSEVSPLKGCKFDWSQLLLLEPYLKATVEHCTFALGLLHDQFESDVTKNVVRTLKRTLFRNAVAAEIAGREPYPAAETEDRERTQVEGLAPWTAERDEQRRANKAHFASFNLLYFVVDFPVVVNNDKNGQSNPRRVYPERGNWTKEELINKLAQEMFVKMSPRPQMDDLRHALDTLTALPISNENGEVTGSDFALQFTDGKAYLSKMVLKGFESHSLKTIIKEVLERITRTRKQYVYGTTYDNRPYIWDTIVVDPPKHLDPIEVIDPNYFDDQVRKFDAAAGDDMYEELLEPGEEHSKLSRSRFFSTVFSSAPSLLLDTSLDRYVAVKRLEAIGVKAIDLDNMPSVFPDVYQKQVIAAAMQEQEKPLLSYPECFPLEAKQDNSNNLDRNKRKRGEDGTSMHAKTQKLLDKLGFELPPEHDEDVCHFDARAEEEECGQDLEDRETRLLEQALALDDSTVDAMATEVASNLIIDDHSRELLEQDLEEARNDDIIIEGLTEEEMLQLAYRYDAVSN